MQKHWMIGVASAVLLCATSAVAGAGPATYGVSAAHDGAQASVVEKVARRCFWHNGEHYCRIYRRKPRLLQYGRPRPEELPTGSTAWWRAMDRENRGGFGRH